MSILDNIKGHKSGDEGDLSGGKFNPFRLLSIGEIMVRYTDGIRIKDFLFLAVLTSERLILIDSARQGTGQITKEIPFSVIKQADLERDEKNRPSLAISMEVGGQSRVMRLVFTGLILEPETECEEWFTAINGYPPEGEQKVEIRLDELAEPEESEEKEEPAKEMTTPVQVATPVVTPPVVMPASEPIMQPSSLPVSEPVTPIPPPEPIQTTQPPKPRVSTRRITTPPAPVQKIPVIPVITARQIPVTPVPAGSVRIIVEKPDFSPLRVPVVPAGERGDRIVTSWKFCIDCGAKNPAHARFCQSCKSRQA